MYNIFAYVAPVHPLAAAPGCRFAHPFDREPAKISAFHVGHAAATYINFLFFFRGTCWHKFTRNCSPYAVTWIERGRYKSGNGVTCGGVIEPGNSVFLNDYQMFARMNDDFFGALRVIYVFAEFEHFYYPSKNIYDAKHLIAHGYYFFLVIKYTHRLIFVTFKQSNGEGNIIVSIAIKM